MRIVRSSTYEKYRIKSVGLARGYPTANTRVVAVS